MAILTRRTTTRVAMAAIAVLTMATASMDAVPSAPSNLTAQVAGSTVTLTWTPPFIGPVVGYRLEAGSASGFSNLANTILGATPSLTASAVPSGTYFVRVRAIGLDGESSPSNEIVVTVPGGGCPSAPGAPLNLAAAVNGLIVTLNWSGGFGCLASNFIIQAGSAPGLSNVAVVNVGTALGITVSAPPGSYFIRVAAQNAFGTSAPSNEIAIQVGVTPAAPCDPAAFPSAARWAAGVGGNNHLYEFVNPGRDITWEQAVAASAATGPGWHLATVTSAGENTFVESLFANNPSAFNCCLSGNASGPWLGAAATTFRSNDWRWLTGEPFIFTDWGPSEPFGNGDRLSYATFGPARILSWNDVPSVYPLSPRSYIRECTPP